MRLQKNIKTFVLTLLTLFSVSTVQAGNLTCQYVRPIMETMMGQHFLKYQFDANLQKRVTEQYIKTMDTSKIYFLKSDVEEIRKTLGDMWGFLSKRDCKPLEKINALFLKRVAEREAYAKQYLGSNFKLNKDAKIDLDADKRPWAEKVEELNKYQEDYIQFQIASFLATDEKLETAKDMVKRRYERALKNQKEESVEDLYVNYLDASARALDPHSSFLSKESLEDFNIQMKLSLEGIGATLSQQDGYTVVEQLVTGGAAAKSGQIQTQDKILSVGQGTSGPMEPVVDMPLKDVVRLIRGKAGTIVRLSILRKEGSKTERFTVSLTRQKISLEEEAAKILYSEKKVGNKTYRIGVIDLPSFYADSKRGGRSSAKDVKKILAEAKKKKVDGLVLDLSNNGGGSLEDAVSLAGLFFKTGNVVSTQGSRGVNEALADEDSTVDYNGPLVVLTSRLSASASEIVSGALKDYKRAVILGGDHTFGKGSVQSVVPLPNDLGAIKVTVGMFFIPGGNSTQHQGVSADIVLPGAFARDDIGEKSLDYSLPPKTIKPFISEGAFVTSGAEAWLPIKPEYITELKKNSEKRITENEEFKKIKSELEKSIAKGKVVTIAEILEKKDETKATEEKRKAKAKNKNVRDDEYLKRPEIVEASNVVADLITLEAQQQVLADAPNGKGNPN